jgi:hypothetical protein
MFDPAQILLFIVIIILTTLLVILGIQVFFILKELRKTIHKANRVLDNTEEITESVSAPISSLSSVLMGIKAGGAVASIIKKISDDKEDRDGK